MSKRKREDEDAPPAAKADFRQQRRIVATFTQSAEKLAQAFKTARGFERQKLGRRKKDAVRGKDAKDEARIDAEINALKTLDLAAAARHYLHKSILKIKAIARSPELPNELKHSRAIPNDIATLNIHARLCKSNPVREISPALLRDIKKEFGIEDEVEAPEKKRRLRKKDFEEQEVGEVGKRNPKLKKPSTSSQSSVDPADISAYDDSDDEMAHFADRLGSSDDEDEEQDGHGDWKQRYQRLRALSLDAAEEDQEDGGTSNDEEELDLEDLERQLEQEGITRKSSEKPSTSYDHAAALSLSEPSSNEDSEADEPKQAPTTKKSSFIPSLTMGGYISGSGSDLDEVLDIAPKKNRRGQRARQQIWEKKFGKRAKHLQDQPEDRGSGWDAKRGAVGGRSKGTGMNQTALGKSRSRFAPAKSAVAEKKNATATTAAFAKKKVHKDDSGPLHPSWEAAKKLKEKKAVPVAFQGKKISFD